MKSDLLLERAHELAAIEGLLNAASQLGAVVLEAVDVRPVAATAGRPVLLARHDPR